MEKNIKSEMLKVNQMIDEVAEKCSAAFEENISLRKENDDLRKENDDLRLLLNYLKVTIIDAPVDDETGKGVMAMGGLWENIDKDVYEDGKRIAEKYSDEGDVMFKTAKSRRF